MQTTTQKPEYLPPCKFAVDGKVRIMKVVDKDGKSYNGFQWPKSGQVKPETWSEDATCGSGGLFGWAWGLAFGDGKDPSFIDAVWIVFECSVEDTVHLDGKCKAKSGIVIHYGSYEQALHLVIGGQKKYIAKVCEGSPNHSDLSCSASSSTGGSSASISTGNSSVSSSAWYSSASISTGDRSASSSAGYSSASISTGDRSASSSAGYSSASISTGGRSASSSTGYRSASISTGGSSVSSSTGGRSASISTGGSSASISTGNRSASSSTGDSSASISTGGRSIAASTGEYSCIDANGEGCLAVSTASYIYWMVRKHSVLVQRTEKGVFVLHAKDYPQHLDTKVHVIHGVIQ